MCRKPGFAAILHTGPIGSATGSVLLGQRGGMNSGKSFDVIEAWRTWPNHSISGLTADGVFFTSARVQQPDVSIELADDTARVAVSGEIPPAVVGQEKAIQGKYRYARSFQIDDEGVRVESTIQGNGQEPIAELYESLPVYLRDAQRQPNAAPTQIEFQIDGNWTVATDSFASVQAVRLTRFDGAVLITFDRPRRAKLSPTEWSDTYLSRGAARNVLIDLLETDDAATALMGTKQVSYRVTPAAK